MNTAYLSDFNNELIDTYSAIKNDPDGVILHLEKYVNTAEEYYRIRALRPETLIEAAARFIYLNQLMEFIVLIQKVNIMFLMEIEQKILLKQIN